MGKKATVTASKTSKKPPMVPKRTFVSRRKLSGGGGSYRAWKMWETGDVLIGKFVQAGEDQTYGKPTWTILVEEAMFSDEDLAETLKGKRLTLNSNGMLDKAMEQVQLGEMVQITYNGTSEIEKGKFKGKDAHQVEVEVVVEEGNEESVDDEEVSDEDDL
jgi:hypothetical protein